MKLLELRVKGFRSLANVTWTPGDLNVVIGANGSGKSNLLKALEFLSSCATGQLPALIGRKGGPTAIRWDGTARGVELSFAGNLGGHNIQYGVELEPSGAYLTIRSESIVLRKPLDPNFTPITLLARDENDMTVRNAGGKIESETTISGQRMPADMPVLSSLASPKNDYTLFDTIIEALKFWRVYDVLPTHDAAPIRQYATVARYEKTLNPDGDNLISVLHTLYTDKEHREFQDEMDAAMSAAFGDEYETLMFPPAADQRVQMCVRWKSLNRAQSATDLSDGTLRFLYLIAILANPEPPSLIAIEHPEEGLHPGMLPIVAKFAEAASKRTQVIFTTHSAEFLDCFREVVPTTTVVTCEDGKTQLNILPPDDLKMWLEDFSLGRLYRDRTLEALA
jgi:predicted ATPase